jgi:hypothetical protein
VNLRIIWSNFLRRSNEACIIPKAVEFQEKTFRDKTRMRILIFFLLAVLCLQLPFTFAQEASTKAATPDPLVSGESVAINFADDELNPPELGIVDRAKERLRNGQFVLIPASSQTQGHMTLREAFIYAPFVADFLTQLQIAN